MGRRDPYPQSVVGLPMSGSNPGMDPEHLHEDLTAEEQRMVEEARGSRATGSAYALRQVTAGQAPAVALNDSPAGLAAWLVAKNRAWSDSGGSVESVFTREEILAELTVYWVTGTLGSSMRLYWENCHAAGAGGATDVPTGCAMTPADSLRTPRSRVERTARVDRWTELPRGGHVPEHGVRDQPAADLRDFVARLP